MAQQPNERDEEIPPRPPTPISAPQNGTYLLYNVGAEKYLDVQGRRAGDGTAIFAHTLNDPPTENQKVSFHFPNV